MDSRAHLETVWAVQAGEPLFRSQLRGWLAANPDRVCWGPGEPGSFNAHKNPLRDIILYSLFYN